MDQALHLGGGQTSTRTLHHGAVRRPRRRRSRACHGHARPAL